MGQHIATTTVIRNSDWIVAHEGGASHVYRTGDVAFTGDTLTQVGGPYTGAADREIDGRGFMVMPGLVNIHSHPASEPLNKGWNDEIGSPKLYNSSLYEIMPIFRPDAEGVKAAFRVALCEALMSGVTTLVDLSVAHDGWVDLMAESGIRGVLGPMYRDARWFTRTASWWNTSGTRPPGAAPWTPRSASSRRRSKPSEPAALRHGDPVADRHLLGRLFRDSYAVALRLKVPFQTHAAQSIVEFHEMTRRHGMTPIEWLDSLGVLGPTSIIGHGIFLDHHSATSWPQRDDLGTISIGDVLSRIARPCSSAAASRCRRSALYPARREDRHRYRHLSAQHDRGDAPRAVRVAHRRRNVFDLRTSDIFNAATLGGAAALQRDDIGRLAPGAKADW